MGSLWQVKESSGPAVMPIAIDNTQEINGPIRAGCIGNVDIMSSLKNLVLTGMVIIFAGMVNFLNIFK